MFYTSPRVSEKHPVIDTHFQNLTKYGVMQLINHSKNDDECNVQFVG